MPYSKCALASIINYNQGIAFVNKLIFIVMHFCNITRNSNNRRYIDPPAISFFSWFLLKYKNQTPKQP
jgi:hypothetical protein